MRRWLLWKKKGASTLSQQEIDDPAAAHMLAGLAAVVQDVGIVAARFFQGVGQDRQTVKYPVIINGLGDSLYYSLIPSQPRRIDGRLVEGIPE
jgi:hypothetical protein